MESAEKNSATVTLNPTWLFRFKIKNKMDVACGVPQGSVLGLKLFIFYIMTHCRIVCYLLVTLIFAVADFHNRNKPMKMDLTEFTDLSI